MALRTAPTINGTPTKVLVSLSCVDASGDNYADALTLTSVPLDIDIEAWVAAYQAATQASVFAVRVEQIYEGDEDPDNADAGYRGSTKSGVNMLWKDFTNQKTQAPRLVAPIAAVMQGNQDIPLLTDAAFVTLIAEIGDLLTLYAIQQAQYTDRRERSNNPRIKA